LAIVLGFAFAWASAAQVPGPGQRATTGQSAQPGTDTEKKDETKPNIGKLPDWVRSSNLAEIRDDMFYLDALKSGPVFVFRRDKYFYDPKISLQFKQEDVGTGERGVGLVFGSTNGGTYHCIQVTRKDVILYRITPGQGRVQLDRRGGLNKPEGQWYQIRVECQGPQIKVSFEGKHLFTFFSKELQPGAVGFYASDGRAWVRRLDVDGKPTRLGEAWKLDKAF
jgi:hypothetical protein